MSRKAKNDSDFMNYVERRLDHWAKWFIQGSESNLGYHSETLLHTMITVGIVSKGTGHQILPCDEAAEEIEKLVNEMSTQSEENKKMAFALRIKYCSKKKSKEYSYDIGLGASQFSVYVLMAKQWLVGRLSGENQFF